MNNENRKPVPNLSREEIDSKLDELRQEKPTKKLTRRRSFLGCFLAVFWTFLGLVLWMLQIVFPEPPQPTCYIPAFPEDELDPERTFPEDELEEPVPEEKLAPTEETPKEADNTGTSTDTPQ